MTPQRVEELLHVARAEFDAIVVDTPPAFSGTTITAIDHASHAVLIGGLDLPGLKNVKVGAETLALMGVPKERITMVLNRADSKVGLLASDVARVLTAAPDLSVPSDRVVPRSLNGARPVILAEPKSGPAKALRRLTDRIEAATFAAGRG